MLRRRGRRRLGPDNPTTSTAEAPDASVTIATIGPELSPEVTGQLQDTLDSTMEEYDVPGAVVGVWVPDQGEWIVAEGLADIEEEVAMTSDMLFPIRSITKSFTVTAILQLADEGELSLDDTIDEYVDDVPNGDEITLQSRGHVSGVADYTQSDEFIEGFIAEPTRQYTLEELNEIALNGDPAFEPGEDHVYSNTSTNLLGVVIEEVTGQSIDEVITERFIDPLQLSATLYSPTTATTRNPSPSPTAPTPTPASSTPTPRCSRPGCVGRHGRRDHRPAHLGRGAGVGQLIEAEPTPPDGPRPSRSATVPSTTPTEPAWAPSKAGGATPAKGWASPPWPCTTPSRAPPSSSS